MLSSIILVAAAADMAPLERDLTAAFGPVRFTFGSSGMLARQIENGAPYDVYLSANERFVEELKTRGQLLAPTVTVYAVGRLGLWSKSGRYKDLKDILQPGLLHVALANPDHAPYGVAAREVLVRQGMWKAVEPKVVYGENVMQALQFARSGNADACITAWSLVKDLGGVLLPAGWHTPIRQAGGVVAASRNQAEAARFLDMLRGPEGRRILAKYGFEPTDARSGR
jgi:molybdate transport system substrate-binding protein